MWDEELESLMPHKIKVAPYSTQNLFGEPTYGADVEYQCLVEQKARQIRALSGEERVSMTTVYVNTTAAFTPRDRVTLPAGFVPNQPPILAIERMSDEDGLHHIVLRC